MPKSEPKSWIVTLSGDRPVGQVAKDLAQAGFVVRDLLAEIGCITGTAAPELLSKLRRTRGVAEVAPDTSIELGPPSNEETW